jgi:hypothetical protein
MPAISADTVALPRIPDPDPTAAHRPVVSVTTAPSGFEGEGFPVRRAFAGIDLTALDPFVHMDQMGEIDYAPGEPKGTPWHPHRGFETVTYMIDGVFRHQDSNGGGGLITDGDTQWMTAGGELSIHEPLTRNDGRLPPAAVSSPSRPSWRAHHLLLSLGTGIARPPAYSCSERPWPTMMRSSGAGRRPRYPVVTT